ncbi:copper-binding protein [Stenotrophomonas indicatrix]|uniref:copper-binding protein n=1 Tax=Stenotrophomonas indicatrix TaxID=2045451 RepID=UPI000739788A|nr:copper-binding protein [Stenotrophomonas indicatrix]CRD45324.1 conserved exported hypothetical protein [Stenotrophomonas indicatrix]
MNCKLPAVPLAATALLLIGCSQAPNVDDATKDSAADMAVPATDHGKLAEKRPPEASEVVQRPKVASATGTVESVDTVTHKITIAHGAVDAVGWPAMTMAFKATPEQVASVGAGQQVHFEFRLDGSDATITEIMPMP